jgi:hypothetical protein
VLLLSFHRAYDVSKKADLRLTIVLEAAFKCMGPQTELQLR